MMNTSLPRVVEKTTMDQILVENVNEAYLYKVASNHERYGTNTLMLSLSYDPASKTYDAMKAFQDLAKFKESLRKMGVHSVKAEAVKSSGATPTLMVAYDSVSAQAPEGCRNMPGFDDGMTTPEIGDYRFGCSVDTMLAKQIYRPSDLQGNAMSDAIDGRRAANATEYYRRIEQEEAEGEIIRIQRSDIQGQ
jgi:pilus biogenesis lipoprotein CpaD